MYHLLLWFISYLHIGFLFNSYILTWIDFMLFIFQLRLHWWCHVDVSLFPQLIAKFFFSRTSWWLFLFFNFILLLMIYIGKTLLEINNLRKKLPQVIWVNITGGLRLHEVWKLMWMWSTNSYLCQMLACINFVTVITYMSAILPPERREWRL